MNRDEFIEAEHAGHKVQRIPGEVTIAGGAIISNRIACETCGLLYCTICVDPCDCGLIVTAPVTVN
jgi:hypothetical protein